MPETARPPIASDRGGPRRTRHPRPGDASSLCRTRSSRDEGKRPPVFAAPHVVMLVEPGLAKNALPSLSVSDWFVNVAFGVFLLGYVAGLGLVARWMLRWAFGA